MNTTILDKINNSSNLNADDKGLLNDVYGFSFLQTHALASALDKAAKNEDYSDLLADAKVKSAFERITTKSQGSALNIIKFMSDTAEESGISLAAAGPAQASSEEASDAVAEKNEFNIKIANTDSMEKMPAVKYLKELLGIQLTAASALLVKDVVLPGADGKPKTFTKAECEVVMQKLQDCKVLTEKI